LKFGIVVPSILSPCNKKRFADIHILKRCSNGDLEVHDGN